ncbi:MAG: tetratricopeptide repeat protein, partial [Vicinamibacterales bacterium]
MSTRRSPRRQHQPRPLAPPATSSRIWWRVALLVVVGGAIYANSVDGPFVFDDGVSIVTNSSIRAWSSRVLAAGREVPTAGRPLVNLSMAVNYALGGLAVRGYHLWNIGCHLLCAIVLLAATRRALLHSRVPDWLRQSATNVALVIALIWVVHPLNSEVVDYLTERSESMMALAFLITIYASDRAMGSKRRRLWQAIGVAACAAGMACKESMVTAPVAVVFYDATLVFGSLARALRERWRYYGALATTWLILIALLRTDARIYSAGFSTGVSPWVYLLNQTIMLVRYLRLAAWPSGLVVNYGWPRALTLAEVLPYALVVVGCLGVAALALWRRPTLGVLGAWFFLTLAPTSSILPIATEVGAERRMYLPLIALIALAVIGLAWAARQLARGPAIAATVAAVVVAALGATTMARNREYASPLGLAETVLARWPTPSAEAAVGQELAVAGRHDEAIARLEEAAPHFARAYYHLGGELFNQGRIDEAVPALEQFVRLEPMLAEAVPARTMIGRAFMLQKRWPQAEEQLRLVLSMTTLGDRAHTTALGFLADSLFARQDFAAARSAYESYLQARPDDAGAVTNLAVSLSALGQLDQA